jgi:hypothetical protein
MIIPGWIGPVGLGTSIVMRGTDYHAEPLKTVYVKMSLGSTGASEEVIPYD